MNDYPNRDYLEGIAYTLFGLVCCMLCCFVGAVSGSESRNKVNKEIACEWHVKSFDEKCNVKMIDGNCWCEKDNSMTRVETSLEESE